jgi:hypothetical protein
MYALFDNMRVSFLLARKGDIPKAFTVPLTEAVSGTVTEAFT